MISSAARLGLISSSPKTEAIGVARTRIAADDRRATTAKLMPDGRPAIRSAVSRSSSARSMHRIRRRGPGRPLIVHYTIIGYPRSIDANVVDPSLAIADDRGADILWTLNNPDIWQVLVGERGWTPEQYEQRLTEIVRAQLLGDEPKKRRRN